jgi:hypothetical protein
VNNLRNIKARIAFVLTPKDGKPAVPYYRPYYATYGVAATYFPSNGTYAVGGYAYGPYNAAGRAAWYTQWGSSTIARGGDTYQTGHVVSNYGSTAVAKGPNNLYAGHDGNVYKRDDNGNWSKYDNGQWQPVTPPPAIATTSIVKARRRIIFLLRIRRPQIPKTSARAARPDRPAPGCRRTQTDLRQRIYRANRRNGVARSPAGSRPMTLPKVLIERLQPGSEVPRMSIFSRTPKGQTGLRNAARVRNEREAKIDRKEKEHTAAVD